MPFQYCGFTNRILIQDLPDKKNEQYRNYYIPVYVILKIKNIKDIDI